LLCRWSASHVGQERWVEDLIGFGGLTRSLLGLIHKLRLLDGVLRVVIARVARCEVHHLGGLIDLVLDLVWMHGRLDICKVLLLRLLIVVLVVLHLLLLGHWLFLVLYLIKMLLRVLLLLHPDDRVFKLTRSGLHN